VARPPLIVVAGATATGKTGLSIRLAEALRADATPAEIISADSRQVYRGLDIGTAKVTDTERARVPHHGLDLVDPDQPFTVADFAAHAAAALDGIADRGSVAILVGGTGLYLRAVAGGLPLDELPYDPELRARLDAELATDGLAALLDRLDHLAPGMGATVDRRNPRRVVRALEIATLAGDVRRPPARGYDGPIAWLGLTVTPAIHRAWIERRAAAQFATGLLEEAAALRTRFDPALPAFSAIGYQEAWAVLDGRTSLEEGIELDIRRNVAFARRQRTWFRAEPAIEWLDATADPLPPALARLAHMLAS
jgi:tRNA dimethylallyltransferase